MRSLIPRGVGTVLALALVGSAAACSDPAGPAASPKAAPASPAAGAIPPVHLTHIPTVTDSSKLVYPIDAYLPTDDDAIAFGKASGLLETECMKQFGFTLTAGNPDLPPGDATDTNAPRRYGVSDAAQVARLGYHPPAGPQQSRRTTLTDAELLVLTGRSATDSSSSTPPPATYDGRAVPTGGCTGRANARLTAQGGSPDGDADPAAEYVNTQSLALSQREPQVVAVFKAWSQCMAQRGYHYATPYAAINDHAWDTARPSAAEIRTAAADVACKASTNLVGIWYAVDSALQEQLIAANRQRLDQVEAGIAAETAAAREVLAAAG